jgi:hypothetical protein
MIYQFLLRFLIEQNEEKYDEVLNDKNPNSSSFPFYVYFHIHQLKRKQ